MDFSKDIDLEFARSNLIKYKTINLFLLTQFFVIIFNHWGFLGNFGLISIGVILRMFKANKLKWD